MAKVERITERVTAYLEGLLLKHETFTGRLELNFKDGELKDINETRRTRCEEGN